MYNNTSILLIAYFLRGTLTCEVGAKNTWVKGGIEPIIYIVKWWVVNEGSLALNS